MAQTKLVSIAQLKAGDIVREHGGRFLVTENARESQGHRPKFWDGFVHRTLQGPCVAAVAKSICIEGEVKGYFSPGREWTMQGAYWVMAQVEVAA
jgi:hypothetical protein